MRCPRRLLLATILIGLILASRAAPAGQPDPATRPANDDQGPVVLKPARVFVGDGAGPHPGWVVVVRGSTIAQVGPEGDVAAPEGARVLALTGATLLPGLID